MSNGGSGRPWGRSRRFCCCLRAPTLGVAVLIFPTLVGCLAKQTTLDKKIYRVSTAFGDNYYRVRITSDAINSKTKYRTGLYPAYAVNIYLGQQASLPTEAIDAENNMRKAVAIAQETAFKAYLAKDASEEARTTAARRLQALQEVPLIGEPRIVAGIQYTPMGFNPLRSLVDYTYGKQFVIALAADPDAILEQIAAFAEDPKTTQAVMDVFGGFLLLSKAPEAQQGKQANEKATTVKGRLTELLGGSISSVTDLESMLTEAGTLIGSLP